LDLDGSGDDFAGHIFDLEFSTDADFLFVGTGKGVWRADLTLGQTAFTGSWTPIGPWITLGGAGVVSPEIRTLAFAEDGADDDLVAGSWGFGAFAWDVPNTSSVVSEIALKEDHVTFLAPSTGGDVFVGTNLGSPEVVSLSGTTSTAAEAEEAALPTGYALGQNYPNPFNPTSTIGFALPASGQVRLSVYDALGREVAVLVDARMEAGVHEVQFEAGDLPSGTYLYRLQTVDGAIARTLILMK
ncbi:MAG: T9SS type A sorting domain-containing protein, partial [Rhodothermales bacterium]|nr:T9SS type A sorting domain-containing protein [Rhodothermales bacterium]